MIETPAWPWRHDATAANFRRMALTATIYNFDVQLADVDRGVYESLSFKVAQQPSETAEYLLSRVLAYCLEYAEGIAFSKGIAEPDVPALSVRDLTGALQVWIDVGAPDAARLHKASKASPRVAVYTHRDPARLVTLLAGEKIHRAAVLELYGLSRELIDGLVQRLDRRNKWEMSITDRHVYVAVDGVTIEGDVERHALV
ncbi:YaeQ family protein [soil metagenome]